MYLIDRANNIDNRPTVATIHGIAVPQYPYKLSEMPLEMAAIDGIHHQFYDTVVTAEEQADRQRDTFEALLLQQGLPKDETYKRLRDIMAVYKGSSGGCGDFQKDFENYQADTQLYDIGLKKLVAEHTFSAMWSVFCIDKEGQRLYYITEVNEEERTFTSEGIIDVTRCISNEFRNKGITMPSMADLEDFRESLGLLLWGMKDSVVVKYIQAM